MQVQLAKCESLLKQERHAHSKALQENEERMQALQLKCYISETRSRAFEEALEQHNQAVANNVALTPSKSTRGSNANEQESFIESATNKPLYSRTTSSSLNEE